MWKWSLRSDAWHAVMESSKVLSNIFGNRPARCNRQSGPGRMAEFISVQGVRWVHLPHMFRFVDVDVRIERFSDLLPPEGPPIRISPMPDVLWLVSG